MIAVAVSPGPVDVEADTLPPPHSCPVDGVVRYWTDLVPAWERDDYGLAGAHCPGCGTTLCREAP